MTLSYPVNIRLPEKQHIIYQAEAASRGLSLSAYLRQKLEQQDTLNQQLYHLHQAIAEQNKKNDLPTSFKSENSSILPSSEIIQLETLLLMRTICNPGNMRMIHSELKRLGYQPWSPGESGQPKK